MVLQLGRQLIVLEDGKSRARLQLLIVEGEQVGLGLLYLEQHFLAHLLNGLDLLTLAISNI